MRNVEIDKAQTTVARTISPAISSLFSACKYPPTGSQIKSNALLTFLRSPKITPERNEIQSSKESVKKRWPVC